MLRWLPLLVSLLLSGCETQEEIELRRISRQLDERVIKRDALLANLGQYQAQLKALEERVETIRAESRPEVVRARLQAALPGDAVEPGERKEHSDLWLVRGRARPDELPGRLAALRRGLECAQVWHVEARGGAFALTLAVLHPEALPLLREEEPIPGAEPVVLPPESLASVRQGPRLRAQIAHAQEELARQQARLDAAGASDFDRRIDRRIAYADALEDVRKHALADAGRFAQRLEQLLGAPGLVAGATLDLEPPSAELTLAPGRSAEELRARLGPTWKVEEAQDRVRVQGPAGAR